MTRRRGGRTGERSCQWPKLRSAPSTSAAEMPAGSRGGVVRLQCLTLPCASRRGTPVSRDSALRGHISSAAREERRVHLQSTDARPLFCSCFGSSVLLEPERWNRRHLLQKSGDATPRVAPPGSPWTASSPPTASDPLAPFAIRALRTRRLLTSLLTP
jgi:hypothetical protein